MELILQGDLPHQTRPVSAIADVFANVPFEKTDICANPVFDLSSENISNNIISIKADPDNNVPESQRNNVVTDVPLGLDIRMETGTGKTYVYTRTIFELHKRYGISKFIIIVPTLPIKAGAKSFLSEAYVSQHFADTLGYDAKIELSVVTPMKTKKGKRYFPSSVRSYIGGNLDDKIQVLLVNQALISSAKVLSREDYDTSVRDFFRPFDALRSTRSFVIIDEPHKFDKANVTYKTIVKELAPQCIIRFGATFPTKTQGRGKNKIEVDDYANLLFDLTAKDAFDQNLIKGVAKEHLEIPDVSEEKVKVMSTTKGTSVILRHTNARNSVTRELSIGEPLSLISADFAGLTISEIGKDSIVLSNSQEKKVGEEFAVDAYSVSYQEQMLRLALKRHFETERENFSRPIRIKTLALFFIDSIQSFRGNQNGEDAWLRELFEKLLAEQLDYELSLPCSDDYKAYLLSTKANISASIAGYFAQDADESEAGIANEVDAILHKKKELLSFDGELGICRFLFSKWTLREGWDNPNVFTIAKLRSSGSEISKLQEVGRGLRLPVDELGNRISNEQFLLNYIIDFTEKDFASKLVAEINGQRHEVITNIPRALLVSVATKRGSNEMELMMELYRKGYIIDSDRTINTSKLFDLYAEYPEFNTSGLVGNKIKDRNAKASKEIKIRPARYEELRQLWEELNRKYIIFFEKDVDKLVEDSLLKILDDGVFSNQVINSIREQVGIQDGTAVVMESAGTQQLFNGKRIPYREFLKRANRATSVPIMSLHRAIVSYSKLATFSDDFINETSLTRFVNKFNEWRSEHLQGRFSYHRAATNATETALSKADGSPKKVITQGLVGIHMDYGIVSDKFLYDSIVYDSPLERENVLADIDEVIVYGKIPRKSISIPTIADSSYSPDFMYVVKKSNGDHELNIVVETKSVENETELRGNEKIKISCAERFFEQLKVDGYTVHFRRQINHESMLQIVKGIVTK